MDSAETINIKEEMVDVNERMSRVMNLTRSSVNSVVDSDENCYEENRCGCTPYELTENFPCCCKPFDFSFGDRLPFLKWLFREYIPCRLPFIEWLHGKYKPRGPGEICNTLLHDIIAGLAVGLMVVPQALAYANIAGLPIQVGINSLNL